MRRSAFFLPKVMSERLLSRTGHWAVVGFFATAIVAVLLTMIH